MADEQQEQVLERVDPRPRSVSGAYLGRIVNPDPARVYLLANPNDDAFGAAASEADGWKYLMSGCKEKVTGARLAPDGSKKLMVRGQLVMWRPKEEQEAYLAEKHGAEAARVVDEHKKTEEVIDGDKRVA